MQILFLECKVPFWNRSYKRCVGGSWIRPLFFLGKKMTEKKGIESFREALEPILFDLGYACVRLILKGGRSPLLQIMIERRDGVLISVADCTRVTKRVLDLLEEKDPIGGDYTIEVSSPGDDRPLTKREDFKRFVGSLVKISLFQEAEGLKKVQGKILSVREDVLMLEIDQGPGIEKKVFRTSLWNIRQANLKPSFDLQKGIKVD